MKTSEEAQGKIAGAMVELIANKSALVRFELDGNILGDVRELAAMVTEQLSRLALLGCVSTAQSLTVCLCVCAVPCWRCHLCRSA